MTSWNIFGIITSEENYIKRLKDIQQEFRNWKCWRALLKTGGYANKKEGHFVMVSKMGQEYSDPIGFELEKGRVFLTIAMHHYDYCSLS